MSELSAVASAEARNSSPVARNLPQIVLRRLASKKNNAVAAAIGRDDSYISRITSGEVGIKLDDLQRFLAALDLKVVDTNQVCVDKEVYQSYRILAQRAITDPKTLNWEEDE